MVKIIELTPQQINAALVDVQNQINQIIYRIDKVEKELNQLIKDKK